MLHRTGGLVRGIWVPGSLQEFPKRNSHIPKGQDDGDQISVVTGALLTCPFIQLSINCQGKVQTVLDILYIGAADDSRVVQHIDLFPSSTIHPDLQHSFASLRCLRDRLSIQTPGHYLQTGLNTMTRRKSTFFFVVIVARQLIVHADAVNGSI